MIKQIVMIIIYIVYITMSYVSCISVEDNVDTDKDSSVKRMNADKQLTILSKQILSNLYLKYKPRVAVTIFTDIDGRERKLGKYIAEELILRLYQTKKFQIIERERIDKIMKEYELTSSSLFNTKSSRKFGKLVGADVIVIGTMTELGYYIKINARVINIRTAEIFSVASVKIYKNGSIAKLWGSEIIKPGFAKVKESNTYKKPGMINVISSNMLSYKSIDDKLAYNKGNSQMIAMTQQKIEKLNLKWSMAMSQYYSKNNQIDICIILDSTGSMADEILSVKVEIKNIIANLRQRFPRWTIRCSVVTYRDISDEYVVKLITFTTDIMKIYQFLSGIEANGGGDYPEALIEALDKVDQLNWHPQAVKMAIVITDAPAKYHPLIPYNQMLKRLMVKKIKIYSLLCSGIRSDDIEEFKWMARISKGKTRFLKYYSFRELKKRYRKRYGEKKAEAMTKEVYEEEGAEEGEGEGEIVLS